MVQCLDQRQDKSSERQSKELQGPCADVAYEESQMQKWKCHHKKIMSSRLMTPISVLSYDSTAGWISYPTCKHLASYKTKKHLCVKTTRCCIGWIISGTNGTINIRGLSIGLAWFMFMQNHRTQLHILCYNTSDMSYVLHNLNIASLLWCSAARHLWHSLKQHLQQKQIWLRCPKAEHWLWKLFQLKIPEWF